MSCELVRAINRAARPLPERGPGRAQVRQFDLQRIGGRGKSRVGVSGGTLSVNGNTVLLRNWWGKPRSDRMD